MRLFPTPFVLGVLVVSLLFSQTAAKRPLTHQDYDQWRSIQSQQLSPNGAYLAYALFPQVGDGELVVRNLTSNAESRFPVGSLPPPVPPNPAAEPDEPPPLRGITIRFSPDNKTLVFSTLPTQAERDRARREKVPPAQAPKNGLGILDLASGALSRVANVKSFRVTDKGEPVLAYLREPEPTRQADKPAEAKPSNSKKKEYGGGLVVRQLAQGKEQTFAHVNEYVWLGNNSLVGYAVSSPTEEENGVYVAGVSGTAPQPVLRGKGSYTKLTASKAQDKLAFLSTHGDAAAERPQWTLYLHDRKPGNSAAVPLVSAATAGLPQGFTVSSMGAPSFSENGQRVFLGLAPQRQESAAKKEPAEDEPVYDLWHWKDSHVQPMQKVRAQVERNRSYRAVYHLDSGKLVALANVTMAEITPSEDGLWGLGADDREYRSLVEYDERFADTYLVNTRTGERKLLAKKHVGRIAWAPDGKHALLFDGKDWNSISVPDGKSVNLTQALGVRFFNEENDTSGTPQPYGVAGWTQDGRSVLVYDHYDIWLLAADGSASRNITESLGRQQRTLFRHVKLDPDEKTINSAKPFLLRAEALETRDSGFYTDKVEGTAPPQRLLYGPKNYGAPMKARNADVLVLPVQTFREYADLHIADPQFRTLRKVTEANPQQAQYLWGTAELVRFRNLDGVPLTATLYKPDNFDPSKKYPLLVYIYERLSQNLNSYVAPAPGHSINVSYYTSNGYLVLQPDIAYTVGYPGQSAMKCVMPAVQAVVDKGFVNEDAMGIQGHSWGGYQIAYMLTQTQRFKAASAGAPVANMTSAYSGIRWGPGLPRQFQYERTQSRIGGSLWQYPTRFIENSPVFMLDRMRTPLLMIHNDNDDAVPWYQGIEMYLGLRRLGKEAYLFNYNGEPHGLRKRANQRDYTVRLQQYFDHYLKGTPRPEWMERGRPYLEKEQPTPVQPSDQP